MSTKSPTIAPGCPQQSPRPTPSPSSPANGHGAGPASCPARRSGGAQYGQAATAEKDLLAVYAEAFDRDADPDDFSLEAILAHERGHQLLVRYPRLARLVPKPMSLSTEEILSSLIGSLLVELAKDKQDMMMKALAEAARTGRDLNQVKTQFENLRAMMERLL